MERRCLKKQWRFSDQDLCSVLDIIFPMLTPFQQFDLIKEIRACQPIYNKFCEADRCHLEWAISLHALRLVLPKGHKEISSVWQEGIDNNSHKFPVNCNTCMTSLSSQPI